MVAATPSPLPQPATAPVGPVATNTPHDVDTIAYGTTVGQGAYPTRGGAGYTPPVDGIPASALNVNGLNAGAGVNAAFAGVTATLKRGFRSTCIAIIGDSTGDGRLVGSPSTLVDEWPVALVKKIAAKYPAYTLLERKWNDTAQGYDAPITWQTGTTPGIRSAVFNKLTAGGLFYNGAAITTDLDVRLRLTPTTPTPTGDQIIAGKWEGTSNQRSWIFGFKTTGALLFNWSTAGTAGAGEQVSTATVQSAAAYSAGNPVWVRATLTLNNGASGTDVKFYTSADGVTWVQLGNTVTVASSTLFGGTAPYTIGSFSNGFTSPFDGKIHNVSIRAGLTSQTSVVPHLPEDWDYYSSETTVAFTGAPIITLLNGSQSGQNVAYFDNATRRPVLHQPFGQAVIMVNTSHNDVTQSKAQWLGNYGAMVNNVKTLQPNVPVLCMGQNQVGLGGAFNITQQGIELRATRGAMLQQWAAAQAGVYSFDAWPVVAVSDTIDQLHPTTGAGSGSDKWANAVARWLL